MDTIRSVDRYVLSMDAQWAHGRRRRPLPPEDATGRSTETTMRSDEQLRVLLQREDGRWRMLRRDPYLTAEEAALLATLYSRGLAGYRHRLTREPKGNAG